MRKFFISASILLSFLFGYTVQAQEKFDIEQAIENIIDRLENPEKYTDSENTEQNNQIQEEENQAQTEDQAQTENQNVEVPQRNNSIVWDPNNMMDPYTIDSTQYHYDPLHYLTQEQLETLNGIAQKMNLEASVQYAIVILDKISTDYTPFDFALELYNSWGLGYEGRGILLLIVMESHDWQFITGKGAEEKFTDALLSKLGRNELVPKFREGDYYGGLYDVSQLLYEFATDDEQYSKYVSKEKNGANNFGLGVLAFLGLVAGGFETAADKSKKKSINKSNYSLVGLNSDKIEIKIDNYDKLNIWEGNALSHFLSCYAPVIAVPIIGHNNIKMGFIALLAYWAFAALMRNTQAVRKINSISSTPLDYYLNYGKIKNSSLSKIYMAICPIVGIPYYSFFSNQEKKYKKEAESCPKCGGMTHLMTQGYEDVLTDVQLTEDNIESILHKVYKCDNGHTIIYTARGKKYSSYSKCSNCGAWAKKLIDTQTITQATTSHAGEKRHTYECACCHDKKYKTERIPRIVVSSSGGYGGGHGGFSGGGGGYRGGGFSGGGGAGGKW